MNTDEYLHEHLVLKGGTAINMTIDTSAIDRLSFFKIKRDLFPVIQKKDNFNLEERKKEAKKFMKELMVLTLEENVRYKGLTYKGNIRIESR